MHANPVIHIFITWLFSSAAACESDNSRWRFANLFSSICSLYNASWRYWDNCHISWAWMPFSFCFGANNTYEYYSCLSRWQSPLMHDCIIKTSFHNMKTLPFHFTSKTDSCHDSLKPILTKVWHCCHFFVTSLEENTMATKCQTDFMAIKASHPFFCCWTKWNNLLHMIQNDISPC